MLGPRLPAAKLEELEQPRVIIAYLFTTFPKPTETFLQREIAAMRAHPVELRLYSLWGGGGEFGGLRVEAFNKWKLLRLFGIIPWVALTRWDVMKELLHGLATRPARSWINFWENMLGAGFAGCYYRRFRAHPPTWVHAAWAGAPATAAYLLWRMNGHRYSSGAHAYDLYEHGGDWWLKEKLVPAAFVHTSTEMGRATLLGLGVDAAKVHCIRRGLDTFPPFKKLREKRSPVRLITVARLVEKKGLLHQVAIFAELRRRGIPFEARLAGAGPWRDRLEKAVAEAGLTEAVSFLGQQPLEEVWRQLDWADILLHTGVVAASGDRDGLPNVIPEAMAAGVVALTSPIAATTEAVQDGETGVVVAVGEPGPWVEAIQRVTSDDAWAERLRIAARHWVEENFDAHRNAERLYSLFSYAMRR